TTTGTTSSTTTGVGGLPAAPDGLTAQAVSSSQINLTWVDHAADETGFTVQRRSGPPTSATVPDESGTGNAGSRQPSLVTGPTWYGEGHSGYLDFDGVNDVVRIPTDNSLSFGGGADSAFSFAAWVRMDDATRFRILTKYASGIGNREWCLETTGSDQLHLNLYDGVTSGRIGREFSTPMTAYEGVWTHIAATYTGSETASGIRLYVDGVRVDNSNDNSKTYSGLAVTPQAINIGGYESISDYGDGAIDQVRIYGRTLSASEVTALFNAGRNAEAEAISTAELRAYYPFDASWVDHGASGANVTAMADTGLADSTPHTYRVRATNGNGSSGYSNLATAQTWATGAGPTTTTTTTLAATTTSTTSVTTTSAAAPPAAPSDLTVDSVSNNQVDLSWQDNSDNETGFDMERRRLAWDGSSVPDESSAGNTGVLLPSVGQGPTWISTGGGHYTFDGLNDCIEVADDNSLSFGGGADSAFSLATWVRMDDATRCRLLTKYVSSGGNREWNFDTTGGDHLHLNLYDGATGGRIGRQYSTPMTAHEGSWIHVAATYSGNESATGIRLYLNGARVDDVNDSSQSYSGMPSTSVPLNIGGYDAFADYMLGALDDVRIYSRELSGNEVSTLAGAGRDAPIDVISSSGLSLFYPFNDLWESVGLPVANAETFADSTVTASTPYDYRIKAVNSGGDSAYSNIESVQVPSGLGVQSEPRSIQTSSGSDGWSVVDGADHTAWSGSAGEPWWLLLSYDDVQAVNGVDIRFADQSVSQAVLLGSVDADAWGDLTQAWDRDEAALLRYLWILLPDNADGTVPVIRGIDVLGE
ncbi:MAG: LamG domain-containing protein, partial [Verrucomicrobia bacterium]|nr:LamG domain-containing protein [Verrucomicrobiota bacterium]